MHYTHQENTVSDKSPALEVIKALIANAIEDSLSQSQYYRELSHLLSHESDIKTVVDMSAEKEKHGQLLGSLYLLMTGENPPLTNPLPNKALPSSIATAISQMLFEETDSLDFYTRLLSNLTEKDIRDILIEIITDEAIHIGLLNYLFTKYK